VSSGTPSVAPCVALCGAPSGPNNACSSARSVSSSCVVPRYKSCAGLCPNRGTTVVDCGVIWRRCANEGDNADGDDGVNGVNGVTGGNRDNGSDGEAVSLVLSSIERRRSSGVSRVTVEVNVLNARSTSKMRSSMGNGLSNHASRSTDSAMFIRTGDDETRVRGSATNSVARRRRAVRNNTLSAQVAC
jgi:hypothetical protein